MQPRGTDGRPITEKDGPIAREYSIESLLVHELGHNTQYSLNWEDEKTLIDVSKRLGWAPYEDPKTHETIWLIETKNHQFYKYSAENWVRCNATGHPVDKSGKVVDKETSAESATTAEVRDAALVRPATDYFDNVTEMFAEATMLYRIGGDKRRELLNQSPSLYSFVKDQDQAEINLHYAKAGTKMIRAVDGSVVPDNADNRLLVSDFEKQHQQKK
jgi:hypothetical protein